MNYHRATKLLSFKPPVDLWHGFMIAANDNNQDHLSSTMQSAEIRSTCSLIFAVSLSDKEVEED